MREMKSPVKDFRVAVRTGGMGVPPVMSKSHRRDACAP
jgi:hypothetical protein